MKLAFAVLVLICFFQTTAFANAVIGTVRAKSCDVLTPVHLKDSELRSMTSHGYRVHVVRHVFKHERLGPITETYKVQNERIQAGDLYLQTEIVPNGRIGSSVKASRQFVLEVKTGGGWAHPISFITATPVHLSMHPKDDVQVADFSDTPVCVED